MISIHNLIEKSTVKEGAGVTNMHIKSWRQPYKKVAAK
jgi:hypothetical protein